REVDVEAGVGRREGRRPARPGARDLLAAVLVDLVGHEPEEEEAAADERAQGRTLDDEVFEGHGAPPRDEGVRRECPGQRGRLTETWSRSPPAPVTCGPERVPDWLVRCHHDPRQ